MSKFHKSGQAIKGPTKAPKARTEAEIVYDNCLQIKEYMWIKAKASDLPANTRDGIVQRVEVMIEAKKVEYFPIQCIYNIPEKQVITVYKDRKKDMKFRVLKAKKQNEV